MTGRKQPRKKRQKSPQEGGSIASILGSVAQIALPLLNKIFTGEGRHKSKRRSCK